MVNSGVNYSNRRLTFRARCESRSRVIETKRSSAYRNTPRNNSVCNKWAMINTLVKPALAPLFRKIIRVCRVWLGMARIENSAAFYSTSGLMKYFPKLNDFLKIAVKVHIKKSH